MTAPVIPSAERESVRRLLTRLQQAYRGYRLYPSDHPAARTNLDELTRALVAHLDRYGSLHVAIEEDQMLFADQSVYYQEDNRNNLAFVMFRDGIRLVVFHPGIDGHEVEAFVDSLAHADDLAGMEYDLTTTLWEHDLQHIEYEIVDPFLGAGGETARADAAADLRETVVRRLGELSGESSTGIVGPGLGEAGGGSGADGSGDVDANGGDKGAGDARGADPGGLDLAEIALSPEEVERGEQAVAELSRTGVLDFTVVLLELAGNPAVVGEGEESLARSLGLVAELHLDGDDIAAFAMMVERLQSLQAQGRRTPHFGRMAIGQAVNTERLARLIRHGAQASPEEAARVDGLLTGMRDWVFPSLLETLAESSDKGVRRTVLALLEIEGGVPVQYLWPLMDDPRWYVVRNAVQLATASGDPELLIHLGRLLRHPDARVRREVMRSLDALGGSRVAALLAGALGDDDSSVRTLAAHGLARHGSRGQIASLQECIDARDFDGRPSEEVTAVLWAYAGLGGEATIDTLNRMWKRRLFGNRPLPVRLAAVQALGAIGSPGARDALAEAARSGELQLQRVASRALAGGWTGSTGPGT